MSDDWSGDERPAVVYIAPGTAAPGVYTGSIDNPQIGVVGGGVASVSIPGLVSSPLPAPSGGSMLNSVTPSVPPIDPQGLYLPLALESISQGVSVSTQVLPSVAAQVASMDWTAILSALVSFFNSGLLGKAISFLKGVLGSGWFKLIAGLFAAGGIAATIFNWLKRGKNKKRKRVSIGANPRVGTLIKVAKRTDRLTRQLMSRFRHAGLLQQPHRHSYQPYRHRRHRR